MNIHVILATTILEKNTPNTFPLKAYVHAADAILNQKILSSKDHRSEYKTEAVTYQGELHDEVVVVSEVRGLNIFTHKAFASMEMAKRYKNEKSQESLGYLRTDTLTII